MPAQLFHADLTNGFTDFGQYRRNEGFKSLFLIATGLILELAFLGQGNEVLAVIVSLLYERFFPGLELRSRDNIVYAERETVIS